MRGEKAMRVLVVDDDETFCRLLVEILEAHGMEAVWTIDGLVGYEMASRHPYDVFIIDVRMPLVLGTELADALKKDHPRARIILVSAFADEPLLDLSERIGVPLLSKPFSANRLLQMVERAWPSSKNQEG
jgi:DNA-binding NtrC family response regulator